MSKSVIEKLKLNERRVLSGIWDINSSKPVPFSLIREMCNLPNKSHTSFDKLRKEAGLPHLQAHQMLQSLKMASEREAFSEAVNSLIEKGLVVKEHLKLANYRGVTLTNIDAYALTPEGEDIAEAMEFGGYA